MYGIIYCATNNLNNKKYIGQTKNSLEYRKLEHINQAKRKQGFYFHKALLKYKFDFTWNILKECSSQKELDEQENYYINIYDTFNSNKGYNLTSGGDFCNKIKYSSEEINFIIQCRRELKGEKEILNIFNSQFKKELKNVYSIHSLLIKHLSKEELKEIKFNIKSKNSKLRIETKKSRENRSNSQKGKKHSKETIEKIRSAKLRFKHSSNSILKMTLNNKRRINFSKEETQFVKDCIEHKFSYRKTIMLLNEKYNYKINLTSKGVIKRILKQK